MLVVFKVGQNGIKISISGYYVLNDVRNKELFLQEDHSEWSIS